MCHRVESLLTSDPGLLRTAKQATMIQIAEHPLSSMWGRRWGLLCAKCRATSWFPPGLPPWSPPRLSSCLLVRELGVVGSRKERYDNCEEDSRGRHRRLSRGRIALRARESESEGEGEGESIASRRSDGWRDD